MKKSLLFTVLSVTLLVSILSFSSMNTAVFTQENQTGTENEAEVEVDIEQENKCKKDSECKNENEINNSLTITTTQGQEEEQPETPTCEDCFTSILSEEQITSYLTAFGEATGQGPFNTLEQLCDFIDANDVGEDSEILDQDLLEAAEFTIPEEQYEALIECLQDVGLDVDFPFA